MDTVVEVLTKGCNGGVESIVMNYCRALKDSFHFVLMIENESKIVNQNSVSEIGGELIIVPKYSKPIKYSKYLNDFFRARKDVKIVFSNLSIMSFLPLRVAKKNKIQIRIAESHSTGSPKETLKNILKIILRKASNRYLTHKFACSKYSACYQFGKRAVSKNEVYILPNAITIPHFVFNPQSRMEIRKKFGVGDDTFLIGNIGRFCTQKNQYFLIDVIERLINMQPNTAVMFLGEGPLEDGLRKTIEQKGLQNHFIFAGITSDTAPYYSAFDCFALPSLYEGLPVVGIEAQASGLPVLLSEEITKECGITENVFFLPVKKRTSIDEWVKKINEISLKKRRERLLKQALFSNFDIAVQAQKLKETFSELLEFKGSK